MKQSTVNSIPNPSDDLSVVIAEYNGLKRRYPRYTLDSAANQVVLGLLVTIVCLALAFNAWININGQQSLWPIATEGFFALFSLGLFVNGLNTLHYLRQLRTKGLQAQAIILDRWTMIGAENNMTYLVTFAFSASTPQGQQVITSSKYSEHLYEKYHVGDTLTVCYLPSKPQVCRVVY